jgi:hypothetical protein
MAEIHGYGPGQKSSFFDNLKDAADMLKAVREAFDPK